MRESSRPARGNAFMLLLLLFNIVITMSVSLLYWLLTDMLNGTVGGAPGGVPGGASGGVRAAAFVETLVDAPIGLRFGAFFIAFVETPWFAILTQAVCFLLPLFIWLAVTGERLSFHLPAHRLGRVNVILLVALCLCFQPFMMLLSALSTFFFPNTVSDIVAGWHRYPLMLSLAAIALMPAFCEEIVFRGYILSQYGGVSTKKAAFVTGLFFAMMHLNAQQFLYAFVMGVIFAMFVYYTRSIYAGVLAHFCVNAVQLALYYVLDALSSSVSAGAGGNGGVGVVGVDGGVAGIANAADNPVAGLSPQAEWLSSVLYLSAVALIFLPAVIILLRTFITHNRQRNTRQDMRNNFRLSPVTDGVPVEPSLSREDRDNNNMKKAPLEKRVFDPFFWATAAVYVVYIILTYRPYPL